MAKKKFIGTIFQAIDLLKKSKDKNIKIQIEKYREKRSISQNSYFHKLVEILSNELGYDLDEMKEILKFKFIRVETKHGIYTRKTSELNTEEMSKFTENIILWAGSKLNISLPTPDDYRRGEHFENILLN